MDSPYDFVDIVVEKEDNLSTVMGDGIVLLQSGENNLEVIVTSEDGNVNTYKIIINNPLIPFSINFKGTFEVLITAAIHNTTKT